MNWFEEVRAAFADQPTGQPAEQPTGPDASGYGRAALDGEVRKLLAASNGTRNNTLNVAAFNLGQLVNGGVLTERVVVAELTAAARSVGLPEGEITATIRSGLSGGGKQPRGVPAPPTTLWIPDSARTGPGQVPDSPGQVPDDPDDLAEQVRAHLPRLDWHALFADNTDEEWIIEPILPARRLVALYSPPKVGKSLLMLELAVGVANGTMVLGTTPDRPRRVLYVDFENDPKGDVRERLLSMGYGPDDLDNLDYLSFPQLAALDSHQGGQQLMAAVKVYGSEVVVIDTVSRAIAGEENENDTWLAFYRHTGRALKAAGVAMIRLDHTGKDETRGQRGGSAKSGDVDAVWRMSRVTDDMFRLDCEANRMPVTEKTLVIHRELVPHLRHRVDAEGRSAAWRAKVTAAIEALDELGLDPDAGRDKAREALRATGLRIGNDLLAEVIKRRKTSTVVLSGLSRTGAPPKRSPDLSATCPDSSGQVPNQRMNAQVNGATTCPGQVPDMLIIGPPPDLSAVPPL